MNRSSIEVAPRAQKTGTFRSETSAHSCAETLAAGISSVNSRPGRPRCVWTVNGRACINRKKSEEERRRVAGERTDGHGRASPRLEALRQYGRRGGFLAHHIGR